MLEEMYCPSGIRAGVVLWGLLSLLSCLPQDTKAQSDTKPDRLDQLKPRGYVSDFAGVIDSAAQSQLDVICKDLDQKERTQMAIVTIVSLDGSPIKEFATQLANRWGVGYKDNNRGVLVLLSRSDKQYRIAVGYGLESVLTDDKADRLGRQMIPMLRRGNYGTALLWVAQRIHDEIIQNVK
jgi:uncharacterized protein